MTGAESADPQPVLAPSSPEGPSPAPRRTGLIGLVTRYGQLIRYLVVGGFNTVFGYGCFAVLNYLLTGRVPYPYMVANVGSNVIAITVAFLGYKWFVFRTKGNYLREYLRTYLVYGSSVLLGLVLLPFFVALVGRILNNQLLVPYVAQAIAMPVVIIGSYIGHKWFSFRAP